MRQSRLKKNAVSVLALIFGSQGRLAAAAVAVSVLLFPVSAPAQNAGATPDQDTETNKRLFNPISTIWALQLQENTYFIHPGIEDKSSPKAVNLQFQPVLPVSLTDDWKLNHADACQFVGVRPEMEYTSSNHASDPEAAKGQPIRSRSDQ